MQEITMCVNACLYCFLKHLARYDKCFIVDLSNLLHVNTELLVLSVEKGRTFINMISVLKSAAEKQ